MFFSPNFFPISPLSLLSLSLSKTKGENERQVKRKREKKTFPHLDADPEVERRLHLRAQHPLRLPRQPLLHALGHQKPALELPRGGEQRVPREEAVAPGGLGQLERKVKRRAGAAAAAAADPYGRFVACGPVGGAGASDLRVVEDEVARDLVSWPLLRFFVFE